MNDKKYYLKLVTSEYRLSPRFMAWVETIVKYGVDIDAAAAAVNDAFSIDTAVGVQLDILGRILGLSRTVTFQPSDGSSPVLTDDVYRMVLKAKIIKNQWKGTLPEIYSMWAVLFPSTKILQIQDLQDMSFNVILSGTYSVLERELITHGYIIPKPEGVRINMLTFVDVDGMPLFSYDFNTYQYSGYGSHWAQSE